MKDKTDSMNGESSQMLSEGYENAGVPMTAEERCHRRYTRIFDNNKALEDYENYSEMGWDVGGFLRRSNPTERT